MINQKDITTIKGVADVSDYIREQKKLGKKEIEWGKKEVKIFRKYARMLFAPDEFGIGWRFPHSFPNGDMFMGIKHYQKK